MKNKKNIIPRSKIVEFITRSKNNLILYKKFIPFFCFYFILSLVILGPSLQKGYILNLDMIFTPNMYPDKFNILNLNQYILFIFAQIIPAWILQKIILIAVLFLSGVFGMILSFYIFRSYPISFIVGLFYMFNPFVYSRLLAGQWNFLSGYALTPIFLLLVIKYFRNKININYILLLFIIIPFISSHHLLLWLVIFAIFTINSLIKNYLDFKSFDKFSKKNILASILCILILIIIYTYSKDLEFSSNELVFFGSNSYKNLSVFENLLTFNGFWAEGNAFRHIFTINKSGLTFMLLLITVSIFGAFFLFSTILYRIFYNRCDPTTISKYQYIKKFDIYLRNYFRIYQIPMELLFIYITGLFFAIGSNGLIGKIYTFLIDDLPILNGMREPQKFLNLYVLCSVIFFGFSIQLISKIFVSYFELLKTKKIFFIITKYYIFILLILTIITTSFPLLWGGNEQLTSIKYPIIYEKFYNILKNEENKKVLFLPTDYYINYKWNSNRIRNVSRYYFNTTLIISNEFEYEKSCDILFYFELNKNDKYESCFMYNDDPYIFTKIITQIDINYIFIDKNDDFEEIMNLIQLDRFEILLEDENVLILKLK